MWSAPRCGQFLRSFDQSHRRRTQSQQMPTMLHYVATECCIRFVGQYTSQLIRLFPVINVNTLVILSLLLDVNRSLRSHFCLFCNYGNWLGNDFEMKPKYHRILMALHVLA